MNILITQSRNIYDYKPILEGLVDDFGYIYYEAILSWCGILDDTEFPDYWQVYLIKDNDVVVGICGLYGLNGVSVDELWLGWFGIVPDARNQGIGQIALDWMKQQAYSIGCKTLRTYVDVAGGPESFYLRNGFIKKCTVGEYLQQHPEYSPESFEEAHDNVFECQL